MSDVILKTYLLTTFSTILHIIKSKHWWIVSRAEYTLLLTRSRLQFQSLLKSSEGLSVSPAYTCSSDMAEMCQAVAEFSRDYMSEGISFAVKARREGNHPYSSMDVGREVGSAIFIANEDRNVKVNLSKPDMTFYVEIRGKSARVFTEYIPGPGGLPFGSQGKVVAFVETEKDALAAWFMMKRGCRAVIAGREDGAARLLREWVPNLKIMDGSIKDVLYKENKILAAVYGYTLRDIDKIKSVNLSLPAFYPLSGMSDEEVDSWILKVLNS